MVDATLAHAKHRLLWFLAGVVAVDMGFAAIAFLGYHFVIEESNAAQIITLVGAAFLVLLGVLNLRSLMVNKNGAESHHFKGGATTARLKDVGLGAFLCGSNPAFLMFWVFVVNLINAKLNVEPTALLVLLFAGGCLHWGLSVVFADLSCCLEGASIYQLQGDSFCSAGHSWDFYRGRHHCYWTNNLKCSYNKMKRRLCPKEHYGDHV